MTIHSQAAIDPSAKIGNNVTIDPFAVIGPQVTIGDGCHIMSHSTLVHTELGENCKVYPQVSLGFEPQHLKDAGEGTLLKVGSGTIFREGVTAHRGTQLDKGVTSIGNNCFFMALSHIAHDCVIGDNVIMANAAQLAGHVEVGDNCFISTMVGVHQFVRVGRGSMISGGSMVPMDVAPYCTAQGDRSAIKGLNLVGLKRSGASRASIKLLKEAYKAVFHSGLSLEDALKDSVLQADDPLIENFRAFLSTQKRGFIRPNTSGANQGEKE